MSRNILKMKVVSTLIKRHLVMHKPLEAMLIKEWVVQREEQILFDEHNEIMVNIFVKL